MRAPGRPSREPKLTPRVSRALILYITFEAANWYVDSVIRAELDVHLREMDPRELDAYHDWRMRWMYNKHTVHPNPGLEWNF